MWANSHQTTYSNNHIYRNGFLPPQKQIQLLWHRRSPGFVAACLRRAAYQAEILCFNHQTTRLIKNFGSFEQLGEAFSLSNRVGPFQRSRCSVQLLLHLQGCRGYRFAPCQATTEVRNRNDRNAIFGKI